MPPKRQFTIPSDKLGMVMFRNGQIHTLAEMQRELLVGTISKNDPLAMITDQILETCSELLQAYEEILVENGV